MKTLKVVLAVCFLAGAASAAQVKYNGYLANESGVSTTKTYAIGLNNTAIDQIAWTLVWSSANPSNVTFIDGSVSTGTITVVSTQAIVTNQVTLCIANQCGTEGVSWLVSTATGTATSIANWMNTNATLDQVLIATAPVGSTVVYATSTVDGAVYNFATFSSSNPALSLSTSYQAANGSSTGTFTGGTTPSYTINTTVIVSTNPFAISTQTAMVALPVLYTQGAKAIGGLTDQTTYYVIPLNSNAFGLSTTSTGAVAGYNNLPIVSTYPVKGTFILLTSSQSNTTPDNYTLKPLSFAAGAVAGKWEVSNDGQNWSAYASSGTVSLSTGTTLTNQLNGDFGTVNFSWMRFNLNTAPAQGALNLQIIGNGKNSTQ